MGNSNLTNYSLKDYSPASGGQLIETSGSGRAEFTFTGSTGQYLIKVSYLDEDDGSTQFSLKRNGSTVESWSANQNNNNIVSHEISTLLSNGDVLQLSGSRAAGEFARLDKVEIDSDNGNGGSQNPSDPDPEPPILGECDSGRNLGAQNIVMYSPYAEYSLKGCSYNGNPFDVNANVTFTHQGSGEQRKTGIFYDGGDTFKFRFTGLRTGTWTFRTSSSVTSLNNHKGEVNVSLNNDSNVTGFMLKYNNKFAVQSGSNAKLKAFMLNVFQTADMDPKVHATVPHVTYFENNTESKARTYARYAKNNGMSAVFIGVFNSWFKFGTTRYNEHSSTQPDRKTFQILERFIKTVHKEGMRTHIWVWGDEERKWTPIGIDGGPNGNTDRRLQRYIAARLGPIPGFSLAYGFDLHEWTNASMRNTWVSNLHSYFGWDHLLSTRGYRLPSGNNIYSFAQSPLQPVALITKNRGPNSYVETRNLWDNSSHPHLLGERMTYMRPEYDYTMEDTRRIMWWTSMAGGMGGWYGFWDQDPVFKGSGSGYPNPGQLRTRERFFRNRFSLDSSTCNELSSNAVCLRSRDSGHTLYYIESSKIVNYTVPSGGSAKVIAVDTKKGYSEIVIKPNASAGGYTFNAPYVSDWAIAVEQ